jgi:hypothetical protein
MSQRSVPHEPALVSSVPGFEQVMAVPGLVSLALSVVLPLEAGLVEGWFEAPVDEEPGEVVEDEPGLKVIVGPASGLNVIPPVDPLPEEPQLATSPPTASIVPPSIG